MKELSEKSKQIIERLSKAKDREDALTMLRPLRLQGYNAYNVRHFYQKIWDKEAFDKKMYYISRKNKEYYIDKKKLLFPR